jgi:hypothetical protein
MSFPGQLGLSGAAIGAGTGHLIGLDVGIFAAGAATGEFGFWVATSANAINISSPLDIPER